MDYRVYDSNDWTEIGKFSDEWTAVAYTAGRKSCLVVEGKVVGGIVVNQGVEDEDEDDANVAYDRGYDDGYQDGKDECE
jgi:hypothetical protein